MVRPVFRAAAAVLGGLFLLMGGLTLIKNISSASSAFRSDWRGPLFLISWGVIFVAIAVRGYVTRH